VRIEKLVKSGGDWFAESDREQSLRFFDALSCEINASDLVEVPIHADLSPGNILVDDDKITVLDFTMTKTGAIYHDVAHLYVHIERLKSKPWIRPNVTDALQKAMLRGFDPLTEPHKPLFKLLLLQNTVCHLLQLATPSGNPLARLQNRHLRYRDQKYLRELVAG
jgi:Ser/Thr protein kinase RdoA (MazF antagonist)